jgi:hypothetical protein
VGRPTLYADGRFVTATARRISPGLARSHVAAGRRILRVNAPRQAVQLDGAARGRSADRRRPVTSSQARRTSRVFT